jgi:hypothetical protein
MREQHIFVCERDSNTNKVAHGYMYLKNPLKKCNGVMPLMFEHVYVHVAIYKDILNTRDTLQLQLLGYVRCMAMIYWMKSI